MDEAHGLLLEKSELIYTFYHFSELYTPYFKRTIKKERPLKAEFLFFVLSLR